MSIPRATTPTLALTFSKDDLDLTTAQNVYVTLTPIRTSYLEMRQSMLLSEHREMCLYGQGTRIGRSLLRLGRK